MKLDVRPGETNRLVVKFVYGSATIITTPAGATLLWARMEKGRTPLTLTNLVPGEHFLEATLEGYDPVTRRVMVEPEATATVAFTFVNTRYRKAMAEADENLAHDRFEAAAQNLATALLAQPGDPTATKLRPGIRAHGLRDRAEELARNGNIDGALSELADSLTELPGDPETLALQARLRTSKTGALFQQLVTAAKTAAGRQDFTKALAHLSEAKMLAPEAAGIAALVTAYQRRLTHQAAAAAKARQENNPAQPREFNAAWDQALAKDHDARLFALQRWATTKSAEAVLAALETVGGDEAMYEIQEHNPLSVKAFTAMLGRMPPSGESGHYIRIGVITDTAGYTRVVLKLIEYTGGIAQTDAALLGLHLEQFRKKLSAQLGEELK